MALNNFVVGWGRDQIHQPQGFGQEEKGMKQQIANLIHAVRTVMRGTSNLRVIEKYNEFYCIKFLH